MARGLRFPNTSKFSVKSKFEINNNNKFTSYPFCPTLTIISRIVLSLLIRVSVGQNG